MIAAIRKNISVIEVTGLDHRDFLNRISSCRIKPDSPEWQPGSFLTATGGVVSLFFLHLKNEHVSHLLVESSKLERTLQFLDKFHFGEDVAFSTKNCNVIEIRQFSSSASHDFMTLEQQGAVKFLIYESEQAAVESINHLFESGCEVVSEDQFIIAKAKAGIPSDTYEVGESNIILEGPFDSFAHPNKGCYPGQEVVERIRTYGQVPRKFHLLKVMDSQHISLDLRLGLSGQTLYVGDQAVGQLLSTYQDEDQSLFGFASIKKMHLGAEQFFIRLNDRLITLCPMNNK